jgi:tRNA-guanine family transglycosylase
MLVFLSFVLSCYAQYISRFFCLTRLSPSFTLRIRVDSEMTAMDLPGYAIGGLAGGEDKHQFWKVVHQCCQGLPAHKPRCR